MKKINVILAVLMVALLTCLYFGAGTAKAETLAVPMPDGELSPCMQALSDNDLKWNSDVAKYVIATYPQYNKEMGETDYETREEITNVLVYFCTAPNSTVETAVDETYKATHERVSYILESGVSP